jgi:hypothetical protein
MVWAELAMVGARLVMSWFGLALGCVFWTWAVLGWQWACLALGWPCHGLGWARDGLSTGLSGHGLSWLAGVGWAKLEICWGGLDMGWAGLYIYTWAVLG